MEAVHAHRGQFLPRLARAMLCRSRASECRERALAHGVKMERKVKFTVHQQREPFRRLDHGDETLAEIGRSTI
jgi:hypothetical protein